MTRKKTKSYSEMAFPSMTLDKKTGIYLDGSKAQKEFYSLLNFVCPDSGCDFVAVEGWPEIKSHVKKIHHKSFW